MADLRLGSSAMLAALLKRGRSLKTWARGVGDELPEMRARLQALKLPPEVLSSEGGLGPWLAGQMRRLDQELERHWIMQPQLDAQRAVQEIGLPTDTAAAVLALLPGATCSLEELRTAVQHPSVTRPLLQHLRQAAEDGSIPALEHWNASALKHALCEAARLGDLPLLDAFAAAVPAVGQRLAQQRAQQREEARRQRLQQQGAQVQQEEAQSQRLHMQWGRRPKLELQAEAAVAALGAAAISGAAAVLRLASTAAGGHEASPASSLLQPAYARCPQRAARGGRLAVLQSLLDEAGQLVDAYWLLKIALSRRQLAMVQLMLSKCAAPTGASHLTMTAVQTNQSEAARLLIDSCGLPADPQPLLLAAFSRDQLSVVQHLVARCGLPADPRPLLLAAIRRDQLPLVQKLLERSGLVPGAAELVAAIRVPSLPIVRALLGAGSGPAAIPPQIRHINLSSPVQEAPYTCPVLATLQERARTDRANAGQLLLIMEALQAAGYRPTVYENVRLQYLHGRVWEQQLVQRFDPTARDARLDPQGANKLLWLALQRPDWSPDSHHRFARCMPRFKNAVQQLLLIANRSSRTAHTCSVSSVGSSSMQLFMAFPQDLLLRIVGQAAYPLSAWAPGARVHCA